MKLLLQRVREAAVRVEGDTVGEIGAGLLVLVGMEKHDDHPAVTRMAERLVSYRVFSDEQGRMNRDVREAGGAVLLVSQFTLAADTRKGRRPSFSSAAPPELAEPLYLALIDAVAGHGVPVARGRFGADMQVSLINDGPVTFLLEL
ncbi:D-aminoacyl-tRNA deacylase [Alloalcanivorax gelatiniphagus]|uniref:D-aminoacyl-tRNA deacylase n=1 Tax=Alloalcanivorax gelatiniphagus TaxID=1194167 RepID=A0ABY2XIZ6_9GAMM|nr:D-aminoacyl-tRNA deacylase [Alloalcanivorax gelatiniphagus]TMW11869.1 D-tyrosyl-tRNA(Tyr) deacylase [Alloalcanivorax gelatiniphagus]|tara:strand:- start:6114 stop:6551 length:438 start_codon:yes stop_codon:yes gene_type:complete